MTVQFYSKYKLYSSSYKGLRHDNRVKTESCSRRHRNMARRLRAVADGGGLSARRT